MKLGELLKGMEDFELIGNPDREIEGLAYDSRLIQPGYLFVAIRGNRQDGHRFLGKALESGAAALVAEAFLDRQGPAEMIRVPDARRALSKLAVQYYGRPFRPRRLSDSCAHVGLWRNWRILAE